MQGLKNVSLTLMGTKYSLLPNEIDLFVAFFSMGTWMIVPYLYVCTSTFPVYSLLKSMGHEAEQQQYVFEM